MITTVKDLKEALSKIDDDETQVCIWDITTEPRWIVSFEKHTSLNADKGRDGFYILGFKD